MIACRYISNSTKTARRGYHMLEKVQSATISKPLKMGHVRVSEGQHSEPHGRQAGALT